MKKTKHLRARTFLTCITSIAAVVVLGINSFAHNVRGLEYPTFAKAHIKSPTTQADMPISIFGTGISVACFDVQNRSEYEAVITAVGLELPTDSGAYDLVYSESTDFRLGSGASLAPYYPERTLDFAFLTGPRFNSDGGRGGIRPVVQPSPDYITLCAAGRFPPGMTIERLLDHVWVRFRNVGPDGTLSDIGRWESAPTP